MDPSAVEGGQSERCKSLEHKDDPEEQDAGLPNNDQQLLAARCSVERLPQGHS